MRMRPDLASRPAAGETSIQIIKQKLKMPQRKNTSGKSSTFESQKSKKKKKSCLSVIFAPAFLSQLHFTVAVTVRVVIILMLYLS